MGKTLKDKPLVEAILEIRWELNQPGSQIPVDPHYKLLVGRLYDKVVQEYPVYEQLPSAAMPDELVRYNVQHRFRVGKGDWPLIQIGPGIFTVNETVKYDWPDFEKRLIKAVRYLYGAHPQRDDFKIDSIMLRYIDAIEFNHENDNVFDFLKKFMKIEVNYPPNLFKKNTLDHPGAFILQSSFKCTSPKGSGVIGFAIGHKEGKPAIIWETIIKSEKDEVPNLPEGFKSWIKNAHTITDHWFFTLIEGELERRFSGE